MHSGIAVVYLTVFSFDNSFVNELEVKFSYLLVLKETKDTCFHLKTNAWSD